MPCVVKSVDTDSPAAMCGIEPGDVIVSIDSNTVNDVLDYEFYSSGSLLLLEMHRGGQIMRFEIDKPEYEPLGLNFETYLMDDPKSCRNRCIFCFIDQLPKGMRRALYFKDDDTRLSFLTGNYVTLTNVSDTDIDRIIKQHISPIQVSVHATDPHLRAKMLGNKHAGNIMELLTRLAQANIELNCQIVLCKGINDGESLLKSLNDLISLDFAVNSVSVVPAGLTRHRAGLFPLEDFSAPESRAVIELVHGLSQSCLERFSKRIIYLADEFYIKAGIEIPPYEHYEDFPQIENGVGLISSFEREFYDCLDEWDGKYCEKAVSIATGAAAYPFIKRLVDALLKKCNNLSVNTYLIENRFFGGKVTVAGLLTGGDIQNGLCNKPLGSTLFLPRTVLRSEGDMFLDDMTPDELSKFLKVPIRFTPCSGYDFFAAIIGNA